jgi:hypothetical protein
VNTANATVQELRVTLASVSPERDLLLCAACVSESKEIGLRMRRVLQQPIDWQSLIRLADFHGAIPLLYQNLSRQGDLVPGAILESLRQRYQSNVYQSLLLARELIRILDCAESLGIELVAYKGIVLAQNYYGEMAMRQAGDLDLFVRKQDLAAMKNAVFDLGYTPGNPVPETFEQAYIDSGYEYTFDRSTENGSAGKNLLELQWALQPRYYAVDYDMNALFARARSTRIVERDVKIPSPEDLLLVLSVHAAKHLWGRLIWLADIARLLKRESINWDFVLSLARATGSLRILQITMLLAGRFFEIPIPAPIEAITENERRAQSLADEIAASIICGVWWEEEKVSYFRTMMRLRERAADRLRFLARLTFTPGPGEWNAVRLPHTLSPMYRLVRLARLGARFARSQEANQRLASPPAVSPPSSV